MEQKVDYYNISAAIVLGGFGLPWSSDCSIDGDGIHPNDPTDRYLLKWYNEKPFKVFAAMGNHDNYDMLEQLPEVRMLVSQRLIVLTEILIMYFHILVQVLPLHLLIPIIQMKNTYRNCSKIQT